MNRRILFPVRMAVVAGLLLTGVQPLVFGQNSAPAPDNTKTNKVADKGANADKQKNNQSDIAMTAQIRKAVIGDKTLSTYAHNVKIITRNGMVTLKGPVKSDEEKNTVEQKATEIAGAGKVTNQITVKAAKTRTKS